ncbi:MAG TPA: extracellular solute-binding protein [Candidatus Paceibacterota bacterium]|nr:extracellular solute-binding protein [Candidatus Paceibacterota bacterium]
MKTGFPLLVTGICIAFFVGGILVFSGLIPKPHKAAKEGGDVQGTVTIWGTFPQQSMSQLIGKFYPPNQVKYVEKDATNFDNDLVEALAIGQGPDLVLIPQDLILKRQQSLQVIPFSVISERDFRNAYLQQGEIYLRSDGILALPFYIDPMVMYWNRDMFAQKGIVRPPQYWDELYKLAPILTEKTQDDNITQSAVALGEYQNVTHAKDILAMLMLQLGNPIVELNQGVTTATLIGDKGGSIPPAGDALTFFTNFADPTQPDIYSWNRALPDSLDMFTNQKLAIYFGYASEYADIQRKNPLLDFDVAQVPQVRDGKFSATIGKIFGVAILKQSHNINSAYIVALTLAGPKFSQALSQATYLPPVRRDLYATRPTDAFRTVFYNSAIISRGWRDPDPDQTSRIFQEAIDNVNSGALTVAGAIQMMQKEMDLLLKSVAPPPAVSAGGGALPSANAQL